MKTKDIVLTEDICTVKLPSGKVCGAHIGFGVEWLHLNDCGAHERNEDETDKKASKSKVLPNGN